MCNASNISHIARDIIYIHHLFVMSPRCIIGKVALSYQLASLVVLALIDICRVSWK